MTYGGPVAPADQPSPESFKLAESLVILEFVADLYPSSGLLPADPVERAKIRFFIDAASHKLTPEFVEYLIKGGSADGVIQVLTEIQSLFPAGAQFAVGNKFTAADIAFVPFLWRLHVATKHDIGKNKSENKKLLDALQGEKFSALNKYLEGIKARKSFKEAVLQEVSDHIVSKILEVTNVIGEIMKETLVKFLSARFGK